MTYHWALRKRQAPLLNKIEMKKFRWMFGVTGMGHVWNKESRGSLKVELVIEKLDGKQA